MITLRIEAFDARATSSPSGAPFNRVEEGVYQAAMRYGGNVKPLVFTLSITPADQAGFLGSELWVLALDARTIPHDFGWPFRYLKICGHDLHPDTAAALANGYQCWSESPLLGKNDKLAPEQFKEREVFGDSEFYAYANTPGNFHSWNFSYSCLNQGSSNPFFAGFDEDLFFTAFEFDLQNLSVAVAMETQGASLVHIRTPFDRGTHMITLGGFVMPRPDATKFAPLNVAAQNWMRLVRKFERVPRGVPAEEFASRMHKVRGYTSWYYHYNAISEAVLSHNLNAVAEHTPWQVFQVDDGYQRQIGDWLLPSAGFPNGVATIAQQALEKNLKPGIWCAPFIVMENSKLFEQHPEWLLRNARKEPVLCGVHGLWGGKFYALDSEHPEVQDYVRDVLRTFFEKWNFKFLKADFLYATARIGAGGLTRAQRAASAHEFLYSVCREFGVEFLSCGATLSSAFGRCDFSRIGADVGETWENMELVSAAGAATGAVASREKVSTRGTLTNTVTRSFLNGVAFGNDPDVIIVRENKQQLTQLERTTLAHVNAALGNLVFCSDDVSLYGPFEKQLQESLTPYFARPGQHLRVSAVGFELPVAPESNAANTPAESKNFSNFVISFTNTPQVLCVNLSEIQCTEIPAHGYAWRG